MASTSGGRLLGEEEGERAAPRRSLLGKLGALSTRAKTAAVVLALASVVGISVGIVVGGADAVPPPPRVLRPVIVNTWWGDVTQEAWDVINTSLPALVAVEAGCTYAEVMQKDTTVGYGGSPDSNGEVTLDALIMDGQSMDLAAVGYLRDVKAAITTAHRVLQYTKHTMLAGDGARDFAVMTGLPREPLNTSVSDGMRATWLLNDCQPNYYQNLVNGSGVGVNASCGPYTPVPLPSPTPYPAAVLGRHGGAAGGRGWVQGAVPTADLPRAPPRSGRPTSRRSVKDHDTVGMCALDVAGNIALGMSSNGARYKVAGRVGDAPLVGAGGYASNEAGCAAATGDGDITARFLPAYTAVESMRRGMSPQAACEDAVRRIVPYYPVFELGLVCMDKEGRYAGVGHGWRFTWCYASPDTNGVATCETPEPITP